MRRFQSLYFALAFVLLLLNTAFAQSGKNYLTWENGDAITGRIVKSDGASLFWNSDLFRGDLQVDVGVLNNVRLAGDPLKKSTTEKYFIRTVKGDRIYGEVTKIDSEYVYVESERHGSLRLGRQQVAQISHLANAGFVLLGPNDLANWDSFKKSKKNWQLTDSGQLKAIRKNSNIYLNTDLPDAVQIELELKWKKKLDVLFGLGIPSSSATADRLPRIESWDDSLVLTHDDDFEILHEEVDNKLGRIKIFIVWDRINHRVFVNDESGKQLCNSQLPTPTRKSRSGIFILNKSDYVSVETLRIGKVASGFDPSKTGIHQTDGTVTNGKVTEFDGTTWTIQDDGETSSVDESKFREAILLPPTSTQRPKHNLLVRFQDGALISGNLNSIKDGTIYIKTGIATDLVACKLDGASTIRFEFEGSISQTGKQVLYLDNAKIQGELVSGSGKVGDVMRWQPVGSKTALPLGKGDTRIKFQKPKNAAKISEWPDTLYFKNRDMIPCRVTAINEDTVEFESFTEYESVSAKYVKAVDFSPLRALSAIQCNDPGWYRSELAKKNVELEKTKIVADGAGHFGHGSLASARSLTFDLEWQQGSYTNFRIKTFVGNLEKQTGGLQTAMMLYNNMIYVTDGSNRFGGNNRVQLGKNKAKIKFEVKKGNLVVSVNDQPLQTTKITPRSVKGRGMIFECSAIGGRTTTKVTISNFKINNETAGATPAIVDPEKKELLLTIPRLRKNNPSEHILCARNGDMLRGQLSSLNDKRIIFKSRLDDFTFDRDVVSSIVWTHAKKIENGIDQDGSDITTFDSNQEYEDDEQVVQVLLLGGQRITLAAKSWKDGILNGFSNTLGNCSIPLNEILEIRQGKFANEAKDIAYADWVATYAKEPQMEDAAGGGSATQSPLVGQIASAFSTTLLDGSEFKLSDYRGKVVVLDFWATWCGPCIKAMPEVIKATSSFKPEDVVLIGVNQLEKPELIKQFLEARKWTLTVAIDADGSIGEKFEATNIPQTVIIDREGKITFVKTGGDADISSKITGAIREILDRKQDF